MINQIEIKKYNKIKKSTLKHRNLEVVPEVKEVEQTLVGIACARQTALVRRHSNKSFAAGRVNSYSQVRIF